MAASPSPVILLLSRDPQLIYLIQRYADNCGCQFRLMEAGTDIRRSITENRPDVLLLDVSQANSEGQRTWRELKSQPETRLIPIILCATSETDWSDCEAEGRLLQPILFADFIHAITDAGIQFPQGIKEA